MSSRSQRRRHQSTALHQRNISSLRPITDLIGSECPLRSLETFTETPESCQRSANEKREEGAAGEEGGGLEPQLVEALPAPIRKGEDTGGGDVVPVGDNHVLTCFTALVTLASGANAGMLRHTVNYERKKSRFTNSVKG